MEAFEVSGEWWLPGETDHRVAGTLSVASDGQARLVLIGELRDFLAGAEATSEGGATTYRFTAKSTAKAGVYPRIVGSADGKAYTLDNCIRRHHRTNFFSSGLGREEISVSQVLRGAKFREEEPLEFKALSAPMRWMIYWAMRSGLEETWTLKEEDKGSKLTGWHLAATPVDSINCTAPDGTTVALHQTLSFGRDGVTERYVRQDFYFQIESSQQLPLDLLGDRMSDLQDLVSMGTGRTAAYKSYSLQHEDIYQDLPSGKRVYPPLDYFVRWHAQEDAPEKQLHEIDMLFTFKDIGEMAGVENWLPVAEKHRSALGRVMGSRYSKDMFVSDRVMNRAAALEGYDKTEQGDDIYFVDRIKRCCGKAGDVFARLVGDTDKFAVELKRARNEIAHHSFRRDKTTTGDFFISEAAYWLFMLCLLRDSNMPDAVYTRMEQNTEFQWISDGLAAGLPA